MFYDFSGGVLNWLTVGSGLTLSGTTLTANANDHDILDGNVHTDSAADAVTRGSLIVGNATPKWDELTIGAADTFLKSDGTDAAWSLQLVTSPLTLTGATFGWDSTLIDDATWSDGSNAANTWTFDVSGTDHTMIAGDDLMSYSAVVTSPDFAKTGWPITNDITLSFVNGTRTFTVTDGGSAFYYVDGIKYILGGNKTVVIDDTEGLWYIYFTGSTLTASQTPWDIGAEDKAMVSIVYWDATNNEEIILAYEPHTYHMSGATHERLHDAGGTAFEDGLLVSDAGSEVVNVSAGGIHDEDLHIEISDGAGAGLFEQVLSPAELPIFYRDGASDWRIYDTGDKANADDAGYTNGGDLKYNKLNGTWANADVPAANHVAYWVIAVNDQTEPVALIMGQRTDTTLANAKLNNQFNGLSLSGMPFEEMVVLARLILKESGGGIFYTLEEVLDLRATNQIGNITTPLITDHGGLGGLGDDDHPLYLLIDGTRSMTGDLTIDKAVPKLTLNGQGSRVSTITGAEGSNHFIFFTNNGYQFFTNGNLQLSKGSVPANPWDFQGNIIQTTSKIRAGNLDIFSANPFLRVGKDSDETVEVSFDETNRIVLFRYTDDQDADQSHTMKFEINSISAGDDLWEWRSNNAVVMILTRDLGLNLQALDFTTTGTGYFGTVDFGTNTITDAAMTGAWNMNSGAMTNINIDTGNIANAVVNSEWDTAYTHSQDNSQAHSDYMLNTGDTSTGSYTHSGEWTFQTEIKADGGIDVTNTAFFNNDIDVTDASIFLDDLDVDGKLTVGGGTDPPYVLIDLQSKEQIVMRCRQEIPLSKAGGKAIVNIIDDERIKWFIPVTGEFYGEKVDENGWVIPTVLDTWDDGEVCYNPNSTTRYYYDRITDTIQATEKTIYDNSFPEDKVLNRDTGEITNKP
jgi:hypothetical protein